MSEAIVAQQRPYGVGLQAGRKHACGACGRNAQPSLCHGSHYRR